MKAGTSLTTRLHTMGDLRVPFGLRDCATDSEADSWEHDSGVASAFSSDSDADSFAGGSESEVHHTGQFDCQQTLAQPATALRAAPSVHLAKPAAHREAKPSQSPTNRELVWNKQDKNSKSTNLQEQVRRASQPPSLDRERPKGGAPRGRRKRQQQPQQKPVNCAMSRDVAVDANDNWGDKARKPRKTNKAHQRPCTDKKILARRPGRHNPPLTGAVVRPFTLPAGPITILRRPATLQSTLEENSDNGTSSAMTHPTVDTQQIGNLSPVPALSGSFDSPSPTLFNGSQGSHGEGVNMCSLQMSFDSHWRSHVVHVTTKYGPGIVVENPKSEALDAKPDGSDSENEGRLKAAKDAAELAMAGLTMGKDGKEPTPVSTNPRQPLAHNRKISADTYIRVYTGSINKELDEQSIKGPKKKTRGGRSRGPRNQNGTAFEPQRQLRSVQPKNILTRTNQAAALEIGASLFCRELGEV